MAEKSEGEYQMEQMLADEAGRPEENELTMDDFPAEMRQSFQAWKLVAPLITPENAPILRDILAELAHIEAGGGIMLARYNTLSDYRRAVRDAVNALMQAKAVRPK